MNEIRRHIQKDRQDRLDWLAKQEAQKNESFNWTDWSSKGYNTEQICEIFETLQTKNSLIESNNKESVNYLLDLPMDKVKAGDKIKLVVIALINNKAM